MLEVVAGLKHRLTDMTHREEEAYQQVKKSVELVEQAQLEQTQVRPMFSAVLMLKNTE